MRSVVAQPEAIHETEEALRWYEDKEPGLGLRFLHDLEVLFAAIGRRPDLFQPVRSGFHRAIMRRFPFALFFEFNDELVIVHAVFHCSRNPAVLRKRLTSPKKKL
jgi:hypothetical protein